MNCPHCLALVIEPGPACGVCLREIPTMISNDLAAWMETELPLVKGPTMNEDRFDALRSEILGVIDGVPQRLIKQRTREILSKVRRLVAENDPAIATMLTYPDSSQTQTEGD